MQIDVIYEKKDEFEESLVALVNAIDDYYPKQVVKIDDDHLYNLMDLPDTIYIIYKSLNTLEKFIVYSQNKQFARDISPVFYRGVREGLISVTTPTEMKGVLKTLIANHEL